MNTQLKLTRVGVTGVKKPLRVKRPSKTVTLTCTLDVFVDLPSNEKSSHLSRNLEAINEVVDDSVRNPVEGIEDLATKISKELLTRHSYANNSETSIIADYFMEKTSPKGRKSLENYKLMSRATAERSNDDVKLRKALGVQVLGMTACPCAMETVRDILAGSKGGPGNPSDPGETSKGPSQGASITHNQRNVTTIMVDSPDGCEVEADDLIQIAEDSISSPTYEILKRDDEALVTIQAHKNPMFVEDVVREILAKMLEKYSHLPDDVIVTVKSESEESIHKHNAFAERITSLGELRK
jgi:GTP cyclohydrolase-4